MLANRMRMAAGGRRYDSYTKILLHFDENYVNEIDKNQIWSPQSGASIVTADKKFGVGSVSFNEGYLKNDGYTIPAGFNSRDFTIDFWYRMTVAGTNKGLLQFGNTFTMRFYLMATNVIYYAYKDTSDVEHIGHLGQSLPQNAWAHIAFVKKGSVLTGYLNGVKKNSGALIAMPNPTFGMYIGRSELYNGVGNIDEFRYSDGIARWDADFTPPTKAY